MDDERNAQSAFSRREFFRRTAAAGAAVGLSGLPLAALAKEAKQAEAAPVAEMSPDDALRKLLEGNRRFAAGEILAPRRELARMKELAQKQKPFAAFLGCADSRVPIEIVFDQGFGNLFVVRVAGNLATAVQTASLEYGAAILGTKVVMVLGHSNCGAVKAALEHVPAPGQISTLYQHMVPAIDRANMNLDEAVRANVQLQARKLKEGSTVLSGLMAEGKLKLVGGYYDLTTGRVSMLEV